MECNHAILSMKNDIFGFIKINDKRLEFNRDSGYIEKDWGTSFPESYIWCQGNNFNKSNASFMLSIAKIPFKIFSFKGIICDLIIEDEEFKFATYNKGAKLYAPIKGKMDKNIFESVCASVEVTLKENNKTIFSDISKNCGIEIVNT